MPIAPKSCVRVVFGLACNMQHSTVFKSGYQAAYRHPQSGEDLFGQIRLRGFASMLKLGFAQRLVMLGRIEDGEDFYQSEAICEVLEEDYDVPRGMVMPQDSGYGTAEASQYIKTAMQREGLQPADVAVVTSFYHLPRFMVLLAERGVFVRAYPAEAFVLLEQNDPKKWDQGYAERLIAEFGGGAYAQRTVSEIVGIARMIGGLYKPQGLAAHT